MCAFIHNRKFSKVILLQNFRCILPVEPAFENLYAGAYISAAVRRSKIKIHFSKVSLFEIFQDRFGSELTFENSSKVSSIVHLYRRRRSELTIENFCLSPHRTHL